MVSGAKGETFVESQIRLFNMIDSKVRQRNELKVKLKQETKRRLLCWLMWPFTLFLGVFCFLWVPAPLYNSAFGLGVVSCSSSLILISILPSVHKEIRSLPGRIGLLQQELEALDSQTKGWSYDRIVGEE